MNSIQTMTIPQNQQTIDDSTVYPLSVEQVALIIETLITEENLVNDHDEVAQDKGQNELSQYYRGQGNAFFRSACLIREIMLNGRTTPE